MTLNTLLALIFIPAGWMLAEKIYDWFGDRHHK